MTVKRIERMIGVGIAGYMIADAVVPNSGLTWPWFAALVAANISLIFILSSLDHDQ